ncbi:MAG: ATP-dependent zinc metalloprotease FtsH [Clostridia bacterium]
MNNKPKSNTNKIFYLLIATLLIVLVFFSLFGTNDTKNKITYEQANNYFTSQQVEKWYVVGNSKIVFKLTEAAGSEIELKDFPKKYDVYMTYDAKAYTAWFENTEYNALYLGYQPPSGSIWDTLYPIIMIALGLVFIYFLFKMFSGQGGGAMGFGKMRAKQAVNVKVRFDDIAGAEEEKTELREIVDFLKFPQRFTELGARIPKGVLLVGPPGTGKTLLARAVAGESGVPFLSISGSDFVEMFVGVGASRVRDLFERAKQNAPCIVFIDEIDAVGRQRGAGLGGSNDEREQTLNQLLVELDGFEANQGIIVLAATNRADVLDPALLRPGRFDRQVYVYPPDVRGREGILKIHAKNKPLAEDVDFKTLARITSGFTGADLENMLNESAILAARANRASINMTDITEGINKVLMGPQKKSTIVTENDKKVTAYHEAGHAIIHKMLEHSDDVHEVSIIPRGHAGGYTSSRPKNDDGMYSLAKLNDILAGFMGGRVAEEIALGDVFAGSSNDIERATNIARKMVKEWGMSEKFGFMGFETGGQVFIGRDYQEKAMYSEQTAADIDSEVKKILDFNYARTKKIITENRQLLENLANLLLEKETVYKEEIDLLIEGKTVEEVIKLMDKKEKARLAKDKKQKEISEKQAKLKEMQIKLKTSEVFLKHGIISQEEYDSVKNLCEELQAEIEQEKPKRKKTQVIEGQTTIENQPQALQSNDITENQIAKAQTQQEKPAEEQGDKQ